MHSSFLSVLREKNEANRTQCTAGFSLLEIVIAMGLLGVGGFFMASMLQTSLKNSTQMNVTTQADALRRNLVKTIANDSAWKNTVNANSATGLGCLAPLYTNPPDPAAKSTCAPNTTTPIGNIVVMNGGPSGGHVVYDSRPTNNGFTATGAPCNSFVKVGGNDLCPFRMDLAVNIICGQNCDRPQVKVMGTMTYAPKNSTFDVAFNPGRYGFNFVRGQDKGALKAICEMLGGAFTPSTSKCKVDLVPDGTVMAFSSCPAGWVPMSAAAGRIIVGVDGVNYNLDVPGGSDLKPLSVINLPSHTHDLGGIVFDFPTVPPGFTGHGGFVEGSTSTPWYIPQNGNTTFDGRMSYWALQFCQKLPPPG